MNKLVFLFSVMVCFFTVRGAAQQKSAAASTRPSAAQAAKSAAAKPSPGSAKQAQSSSTGAPSGDLFGGDSGGRPKGPTEITASQEAQFDVKTRTGVFIGNVKVVDPQFTLTSDRLTVHLNKDEEGGGLHEAEAQGNVVIIHVNQPKAQGQPSQAVAATTPSARPAAAAPPAQQPTTSIGKADKALYEGKDGSITLTGWPQVTQGGNSHIATSPGVKMILYRDGRMQTYGSTRTLIEDRTVTNNPNANGAQ